MAPTCGIDGCCKPAARGGLCWAHMKRKQRKKDSAQPVREYGKPVTEKISQAALRYAEADPLDDKEFLRARDLLLKYAKAYGRAFQRAISKKRDTHAGK